MTRTVLYFDVGGAGGGSNHSLRALLAALDHTRYTPVLCFGRTGNAARWAGETVHEYRGAGFDNYDFFPAAWSAPWLYHLLRFLVHAPLDALRFARVLRAVRPALVHLNCGQALIPGLVARAAGVPVVWHIRELVARNGWGALQRRLYHRCARHLLAISRAVADRVQPGPRPVEVLFNPVRPRAVSAAECAAFRQRFALPRDAFAVLLLGNLSVGKGYLFLREVAALLPPDTRIVFVLAGDPTEVPAGRLHRALRRLYRTARRQPGERAGIQAAWADEVAAGRAVFTGPVDGAVALAACDAVVCPNTVNEPFGRTVAEAQVAGKPVLTSHRPAFDELIEDQVSGRLLPPEPTAWADALRQLAGHRDTAARWTAGSPAAAARYDDQAHARRVMAIYDAILAASTRDAP